MSLINKMLQDLDARGGPGAQADRQEIKTVLAPTRDGKRAVLLGAGAGAALLALAAGGWLGWRYYAAHRPPAAPAAVAPPIMLVTPRGGVAPATSTAPAAAAATATAPAPMPGAASVIASAPAGAEPSVAASSSVAAGPAALPTSARAAQRSSANRADVAARSAPAGAAAERVAERAAQAERKRIAAARTVERGDGELSTAVRAESAYRRALGVLQEGRVGEALAGLERALQLDPQHEAARQTLVSLLLENGRSAEATQQLRAALAADPRQPALAMLLARLQVEGGGPAVDTLLRTMPYAANNADYHAMLAGLLQRGQRNAEAAEHYQAALRLAPQNAVWWMGLGIALQADKRLPEAREAYGRAKAAGSLTAELQAFVERKLEQLAR